MAGRIRDEDIAEVREKARIDDVVSQYVTLKNAGGGSQKGLCPFHDEKSPSFHVTPARGFFHCFGCNESGDVISFLMKIDGQAFAETVERLADKYGVQLRREEGDVREERPKGPPARPADRGQQGRPGVLRRAARDPRRPGRPPVPDRARLRPGRRRDVRHRLRARARARRSSSTCAAAASPRRRPSRPGWWRSAARRTTGSAAACCGRSATPPATPSASAPGGSSTTTGSRRSTSTPPRPGSTRRARSSTASTSPAATSRAPRRRSIVEGYTDVMACHLAGVGTAVATCGTAFGDDHSRVLRRFLNDHEEFRGEVIFTFDGDAAGQKAAIRAFGGDQNFVSQTYVAVEPDGLDPCDVRIKKGDAAVRELVARRVPLYRFVLANIVSKYDLDRADGRVDALRESARLVSSIRDKSKVDAFAREIAGMIGIDVDEARSEVRRAASRRPAPRPALGRARRRGCRRRRGPPYPTCATRASPSSARRSSSSSSTRWRSVAPPPTSGPTTSPTRPTAPSGSSSPPPADPVAGRRRPGLGAPACATPPPTRPCPSAISALAVEPLKKEPDAAYVAQHVFRLHGADRGPPDRRDQVQAAAHQPGRARRRVQQDVRRARRPRGTPPRRCATGWRGRASEPSLPWISERTPPVRVERGEKLLADAVAEEASPRRHPRRALRRTRPDRRPYDLAETIRIPWEQVEAADWDRET